MWYIILLRFTNDGIIKDGKQAISKWQSNSKIEYQNRRKKVK
jgi:hypothetical protein